MTQRPPKPPSGFPTKPSHSNYHQEALEQTSYRKDLSPNNGSNSSNGQGFGSTREHDASSSQATHIPDRTSQQWNSKTDQRDNDYRSSDRSHASGYLDRDDPRCGRPESSGSSTAYRDRYESRRRSRSPESIRPHESHDRSSRNAESSSASIPWKDLRLPRQNEGPHGSGSPATPTSSSKHSLFKPISTAANKRMAVDISKWNQKQAELRADEPRDLASSSSSKVSLGSTAPAPCQRITAQPSGKTDTSKAPEDGKQSLRSNLEPAQMSASDLSGYDYKDESRIACLLCQRKFKAIDTLHRHTSESQLHKDNLVNLDTCREGVVRKLDSLTEAPPVTKSKANTPPVAAAASIGSTSPTPPPPAPTYRDRASERRAVFGADTRSRSSVSISAPKIFDGPKASIAAPNTEEEVIVSAPQKPIDSDNIGSELLAMMGWTQGQGLGLNNQGRTDIVDTKIYKPGAGLGSSVPTDAASHEASMDASAKRAVAFTGYLDRAKDRARQRLAEHSHPHQQ